MRRSQVVSTARFSMLVYATSKVYPLACSAMAASSHCIRPLLLRCGSAQPVNLPWASHVVSPCRTSTCVRAAACDEAPVHTRAAGSGVAHESAARLGSTEAAEQTHANRALARRAARPGRGCRPGREQAAAAGDHEERRRHLVRAMAAAFRRRIRRRGRGGYGGPQILVCRLPSVPSKREIKKLFLNLFDPSGIPFLTGVS